MPDPKFSKPWHGIPRTEIQWNPTVLEDVCIGCGTCVTGCSRLVYRFDFDRKKPVVVDPLNCMVGCTTCANTCPANAIVFPPLESILAIEGRAEVRHAVEDDLLSRRDILASAFTVPHPDRIVTLAVAEKVLMTPDVLRVVLAPINAGECFCEFVPGQYIEIWQPGSDYLSRAYSIANSPHGDGRIELHVRHVAGGRFTEWVFDDMQVGDRLQARGPLGAFTQRSLPDVPLLFVAGGTGFAPIHALVEQQVRFQPARDMMLIWGMRSAAQFYALDDLAALAAAAPGLKIVLAAEDATRADLPKGVNLMAGTVIDALEGETVVAGRDIYAAGPPMLLRALSADLSRRGVDRGRINIDSFGV
ncbi:MAG: FAD-binding oxidoreductase [Paracoccaceae bacterium]